MHFGYLKAGVLLIS